MNIFIKFEDEIAAIMQSLEADKLVPSGIDSRRAVVELPRDETHGDLATNIAMVCAKPAGMKPRDLAEMVAKRLEALEQVAAVEIAGPGFINIHLHEGQWGLEVSNILDAGDTYGRSNIGAGRPVNVEFVSANPTGPLHAAHARGAIFGDALAHLLDFSGFDVTREYYINDAGAQVDVLAKSAFLRYRESLGETVGDIPAGLYPGEYLCEVGDILKDQYGDTLKSMDEAEWLPVVRGAAISLMMKGIKADLATLGVQMDIYKSDMRINNVNHQLEEVRDRLSLLTEKMTKNEDFLIEKMTKIVDILIEKMTKNEEILNDITKKLCMWSLDTSSPTKQGNVNRST